MECEKNQLDMIGIKCLLDGWPGSGRTAATGGVGDNGEKERWIDMRFQDMKMSYTPFLRLSRMMTQVL